MNSLEKHLKEKNITLFSDFLETKKIVSHLLDKYSSNFPNYTDHSIKHTLDVFDIAAEMLSDEEILNLNADETYILSMACLLHDIGMCIPSEKIKEIANTDDLLIYREGNPNLSEEDYIRDIHHELSNKFIVEEQELLKIPNENYAKAIGLVAEGHRKVDLSDFDIFEPHFFAKGGKEYACLPYLACILRVADELDITNSRTPKLLTKYYMPNNEASQREWRKHISVSQRNYLDNKVIFKVKCTDRNIYAALQNQFDKITDVINYAQKIIRSIPYKKDKNYSLALNSIEVKYNFDGFDPKGIKFSFDVENVVTAFIGEELYKDHFVSLREAVQNSIDSCRYKSKVLKSDFTPQIKIYLEKNSIIVEDNGSGMDEFIIENYFGRLASSFYEQDNVKSQFEAIGQFGVGVFSYFLMAEYIDIETKKEKSKSLKFRFDKDPKNYFHFFDRSEKVTEGTIITLHLKEKYKEGQLTFKQLEVYLSNIFKHIEIPITLIDAENHVRVDNNFYNVEEDKIKQLCNFQYRKEVENFLFKEVSIDNDEVEGTCVLIVHKEYLKTFSIRSNLFDYESFISIVNHGCLSKVSVSQKGVFVNNYSTNFMHYVIGDINLKKKIKINIDRNRFKDEDSIYNIIQTFEYKILELIFSDLDKKLKNNEERLIVSNNFFSNYIFNLYDLNTSKNNIDILLKNNLYVRLYEQDSFKIVSINEVETKYDKFIFISNLENAENVYNIFKIPVVTAGESTYFGSYRNLKNFFYLKYNRYIISNENQFFEMIYKDILNENEENIKKIDSFRSSSYREIANSDSNQFILSVWDNKPELINYDTYETYYFNSNHHFNQFIVKNYTYIIGNIKYVKIINSVFKFIEQNKNYDNLDTKESIEKLNEVIVPLREIASLADFSESDFG